jgi:hypothetical protein
MALSSITLTDTTLTVEVHLPQLDLLATQLTQAIDRLGERMADNLGSIRAQLQGMKDDLSAAIDTALGEVAQAIRDASEDPAAIQAIADDMAATRDALKQRILDIIPDAPATPPA